MLFLAWWKKLGGILAVKKEIVEKILEDPKYGKEFEKVLNEFLEGKKKVKHIKKIVWKFCRENNLKCGELIYE
jgi:hypothetical protein